MELGNGYKKITKSEDETIRLGEEFATRLSPQDVVFLIGDLGAGKTTFTKGIAKGLGIEGRIISPTFVVVRSHALKATTHNLQPTKIKTLYHLDLYRLENEKDVLNIDFKDYIEDPNGVVVIEWPEVSQNITDRKVWRVTIKTITDWSRSIEIKKE